MVGHGLTFAHYRITGAHERIYCGVRRTFGIRPARRPESVLCVGGPLVYVSASGRFRPSGEA